MLIQTRYLKKWASCSYFDIDSTCIVSYVSVADPEEGVLEVGNHHHPFCHKILQKKNAKIKIPGSALVSSWPRNTGITVISVSRPHSTCITVLSVYPAFLHCCSFYMSNKLKWFICLYLFVCHNALALRASDSGKCIYQLIGFRGCGVKNWAWNIRGDAVYPMILF